MNRINFSIVHLLIMKDELLSLIITDFDLGVQSQQTLHPVVAAFSDLFDLSGVGFSS